MKVITKIAAVALMAVAATAHAQMARKEVLLDTGKGGIELNVSVPDFPIRGPMDFSGNDGVFKYDYTNKGVKYSDRKVEFIAKLGDSVFMDYKVTLSKASSKNTTDEGFTNSNVAAYLLKEEGLSIKSAQKIDNTFFPLDNAITETVKVCGQPIFEKSKNEKKCSIVVSSVTIDHLQSIGFMATVTETDINAYDSNPEKYSKRADNALKYISDSKARLK